MNPRRVRRLANPAQVERLVSELWNRHGHEDKHGYIDWMGEQGFGDAVAEVIDRIDSGEFRLPRDEPKKARRNVVNAKELTRIAMTTGGEKKYSMVIDEGMLREWVGIGWIDVRKATKADRARYPKVVWS